MALACFTVPAQHSGIGSGVYRSLVTLFADSDDEATPIICRHDNDTMAQFAQLKLTWLEARLALGQPAVFRIELPAYVKAYVAALKKVCKLADR